MMTHQLEVSVLAAPLAAMDRRVLSQAWYSALRLAGDARTAPHSETVPSGNVRVRARTEGRTSWQQPGFAHAPLQQHRQAVRGRRAAHAAEAPHVRDARMVRAPLARAIAGAFADPRAKVKRATFSLGPAGARVHVVLQTKGERATLVALCVPELSDVVAQALGQARRALAALGVAVELRAKGVRKCS